MSGQKRKHLLSSCSTSSSNESDGPLSKRSLVQTRTVEEWKKRLDKDLNTVVWLEFDIVDCDHVASIRCSVCTKFKSQLESMRNFRSSFIDGPTNIHVSTVMDHAGSDTHCCTCYCTRSKISWQCLRLHSYSEISGSKFNGSSNMSSCSKKVSNRVFCSEREIGL